MCQSVLQLMERISSLVQPERLSSLHLLTPTYPSPMLHMTDSAPQSVQDASYDPTPTPQPNHSSTHLSCAPGVHADLAAVITAWPSLAEDVRAHILQLIATEELRSWILYSHSAQMLLPWPKPSPQV